jgi:hypothetical protein
MRSRFVKRVRSLGENAMFKKMESVLQQYDPDLDLWLDVPLVEEPPHQKEAREMHEEFLKNGPVE